MIVDYIVIRNVKMNICTCLGCQNNLFAQAMCISDFIINIRSLVGKITDKKSVDLNLIKK